MGGGEGVKFLLNLEKMKVHLHSKIRMKLYTEYFNVMTEIFNK
jgi:hypothetical protein